MKIKELVWKDNITDVGKKNGLFEIIAYVNELGINFTIRNYMVWGKITDKFYLFYLSNTDDCYQMIDFNTVEEAKIHAQKLFKKIIFNLFFVGEDKKITKEEFVDEFIDRVYLNGTKENGKYTLTLSEAEHAAIELYNQFLK